MVEAYDAARDANGNLLRDDQGHLVPGNLQPEIHVIELRSTWLIEDLAATSHVGKWNFASFEGDGARSGEALSDCFSCHEGASRRNFLFTDAQLTAYANTGATQYRYCPRPARVPCG